MEEFLIDFLEQYIEEVLRETDELFKETIKMTRSGKFGDEISKVFLGKFSGKIRKRKLNSGMYHIRNFWMISYSNN